MRFSRDHVEESITWSDVDKNEEFRVTWSDFVLPEACKTKTLKMYIPEIKTVSKTDYISMSKDHFAQVNTGKKAGRYRMY